ncbi:hypothetical protein DN407_29330 (plasmid) [Bacillus sp. JAS24-2]|uniref:hypothetical protein n=1 Tax=Bacillus sp. JAS24-2 TaxID=2217832 RepID=UPI0011ED1389|nr:hypothetical protein [Bacillus sp. JAS24-2]QEL82602.1 hypothetical protein DN407_29330 [Bacillus sp. JAS24-2]
MGYGIDEPPAIRADSFPATLSGPSGFRILILTFVAWDVIKFTASTTGEPDRKLEIGSGTTQTEFLFTPTKSGVTYTFTCQGCAKAFDGSTEFCSPVSRPITVVAAINTRSFRQFLKTSGVNLHNEVSLRALVTDSLISLRTLMGLGG